MDLVQDHDTAQGSQSVYPPPQASDRQPILRHINPVHDLAKYRILCGVDSVYYCTDGEHTRAAVVLEVGFSLPFTLGDHFKFALFPTRVPDTRLDRFPEVDELVKMSECNVNDGRTFSPNIQAGGVGISAGSVSRQAVTTLYGFLQLRPQRGAHDEIRWAFINDKSNYFPSTVKLLLVVKGGKSPRFPFKLEILSTLEVHVKNKWWHVWTTKLQPKVDDGWSCQIDNDYCPDIAKSFLLEYRKPREERKVSQMVGLHAAVISYLEELQR
ncbi:hypothetical protein AZE42_09242 [Rhizopogon vesiculosus]|uniref:Uncharacterized protein n=1 Tax=Rhizopogon vesiculosus TaxID=180088 RepID=A0A1J8QI58_9AGAM|nr:hypothetical protein AZE42_09242 [Rhizopogon vesiculosus]